MLFAAHGFNTGAFTTLLPGLSRGVHIGPGTLGVMITAACVASLPAQIVGGAVSDRIGRRLLIVIGFGGTAPGILCLSVFGTFGSAVVAFLCMGFFGSFMDLAANSVGADLERRLDKPLMVKLHSYFSGGAMVGALCVAALLGLLNARYQVMYAVDGLLLLAVALLARNVSRDSADDHAGTPRAHLADDTPRRMALVLMPALLILGFYSFGGSAAENFSSSLIDAGFGGNVSAAALGMSVFYGSGVLGRLVGFAAGERLSERWVLVAASCGMAGSVAVLLFTPSGLAAIAALGLYGVFESPVAPLGYSAAGRLLPGRSGLALAWVGAVSFVAYSLGPLSVGSLAVRTSLSFSFVLVGGAALGLFAVGLSRRNGLSASTSSTAAAHHDGELR
ncbi:MFS transporter [Streptomyces sp. C1-2]|uniref:MFS transporter n=1 Tax=Streptomyces sp. C1-2 TaxID=2720022 RepID=UPI0014327AEE|nr:MFS transporter [Streptomyces sp. C1-2]